VASDRPRRPWKVHVREIGPTYTFADEDRARARAVALTAEYSRIDVYNSRAWSGTVGDDTWVMDCYTHTGIEHLHLDTDPWGWVVTGRSPLPELETA
jgi:hypothetical protein